MTKGVFVSLAVLNLCTSAAFAAHPTHHCHAMHTDAGAGVPIIVSPVIRLET